MVYNAHAGELNAVTIAVDGAPGPPFELAVTDTGALVTAGSGCTSIDAHRATCALPAVVVVRLGDRDDRVVSGWRSVLYGGPGADVLSGSGERDELHGDRGNDRLAGGGMGDVLDGGPGPGAPGADSDLIDGGDGMDSVSYSARVQRLTLRIDAPLPSGDLAAGEDDRLVDLEAAVGGSNDDRISGGSSDDTLTGGRGDDTLAGGKGDDRFVERTPTDADGADTFAGGPGSDLVDYTPLGEYSRAMHITLDGVANDGAPGEGDDLHGDVEGASVGTSGPVVVRGSGAANDFFVDDPSTVTATLGGGDDTLYMTSRGPATVRAGTGNDRIRVFDSQPSGNRRYDIHGGMGQDEFSHATGGGEGLTVTLDDRADDGVEGSHGNIHSDIEIVNTGFGADHIVGSAAPNLIDGGFGNDTIDVAGGAADTAACGEGDDSVTADALDTIAPDCEHVTIV